MNVPDYLVQNAAWFVIGTVAVSFGSAVGKFAWNFWKSRRWKGPDRRAEATILLEFLHRQEERDSRIVDVIVKNTQVIAGFREVVEVQLTQCRSSCDTLHKRIDDHVLKSGHAGA